MEKFSGTKTILLVGVGGQGTILAGKLLATVAAGAGLDVKVSEIHGMSQRGGSVSTVIRLGEHVSTMVCDDGCADVVVAFEAVEALRAQHYLAEGGKMFVNDEEITPVSVNIGNFTMPERVDERLREMGAHLLDAGVIARGLGTPLHQRGARGRALHGAALRRRALARRRARLRAARDGRGQPRGLRRRPRRRPAWRDALASLRAPRRCHWSRFRASP